jgi:glutamate---cysteine ligase / carboxylate-amine ligase
MREPMFTVGVEEEYQLVDPETGALKGRAPDLLENGEPAKEEFQRTMIEVDTPVCHTALDVRQRLRERRAQIAALAEAHGLAIAAAGLHPIGIYPPEQISDSAHYHRAAMDGGAPMREMHIFGMHVHVEVPNLEAAVRAMSGCAPYIPHLLALSCSSPFHRGEDTRFESYRTMLRDMSPRVGPPLPIATAAEYERLVRLLSSVEDRRIRRSPISWDIRPSARFPTVEFRFFDGCPQLDTAVLLTAMARALAIMFHDRPAPQRSGAELQLLVENRWRAARFGLEASFYRLDPPTGEQIPARDAIAALIDRLAPLAERHGDGEALAEARGILERGMASTQMRRIHEETGSIPDVMKWIVEQTAGSR